MQKDIENIKMILALMIKQKVGVWSDADFLVWDETCRQLGITTYKP